MFGLGAGEMLIILAFALIFIGPKKLPELARNLGKGLREFQNAKDEFMQHVESEKSEINHTLSEAESESEDSADSEDHDPALTGVEEPVESPTAKGSETSEKISEEEVVAEAKAMEEALKKADEPSTPSS